MATKLMGRVGFHEGSQLYYVRINGKPKYFPKSVCTKDEAELEAAKILVDLSNNTNKAPDDTLVSVLVSKFLEIKKKRDTEDSYQQKERTLNRFVAKFGQQTIGSITPVDLFTCIEETRVRTNGGGKITVRAALAGFFNWCRVTYRTTNLPHLSRDLTYQANRRGEDFVFSVEEWDKMLPLINSPFYRDFLAVCFHTGCRPGELAGALVSEYDPIRKTIQKILHKTMKKGGVRIILLNELANEIVSVRACNSKDGKIFSTTTKAKCVLAKSGKTLKRVAKKIGRNPATVCNYSLRHSFAVRHLNRMVPINIVAKWMGNTVKVCEAHYSNTIRQLELAGIRPT